MEKLPNLSIHKKEDIPDHIFQEVLELADKMAQSLENHLDNNDINLSLNSLNLVYASVAEFSVSDDSEESEKAFEAIAHNLLQTIKFFRKKRKRED